MTAFTSSNPAKVHLEGVKLGDAGADGLVRRSEHRRTHATDWQPAMRQDALDNRQPATTADDFTGGVQLLLHAPRFRQIARVERVVNAGEQLGEVIAVAGDAAVQPQRQACQDQIVGGRWRC